MGCCMSESEKNDRRINREIEKRLKEYETDAKKQFKLLLLGTGESGKSTFIKQMNIIHGTGYTDADRKEFISTIFQNILTSIQAMVRAMKKLGIKYENEECVIFAQCIENMETQSLFCPEKKYLQPIKTLWQDAGIRECYNRRREYQLSDSTKYYFDEIDRIFTINYIPNEQDILRVRAPTTGVVHNDFLIEQMKFQIIDVGGQRSERRKWIHCFDNVTSVLFLVALSEYDQILMETGNSNRMEESKTLFKYIIESEWFDKSSIVLFLNKTDIFAEKIMQSHLADYFPDYVGPKRDAQEAQTFIYNMFRNIDPKKEIYKHYTCATDTENIGVVFLAVKNTILQKYLDMYNL